MFCFFPQLKKFFLHILFFLPTVLTELLILSLYVAVNSQTSARLINTHL